MTAVKERESRRRAHERPAVIHVVDDDPAMRDSLRELLESVALEVQCHPDADAFLRDRDPDAPGCIILDLRMPEKSGLELQRELGEQQRDMPIIFLTAHGSVASAVRAMKGGAVDFLTKPVDPDELLNRVHEAVAADRRNLVERRREWALRHRRATLTAREGDVFRLTAKGLSNKEVARTLAIAPKTAELHRAHVLRKLDVHSAAELAHIAFLLNELDGADGES